ncbi:MAG TPA: hypothetical protein VK509_08990 [Polyangiales bacterium]|nr:hypothetical protein [Polyangiales bacterium]
MLAVWLCTPPPAAHAQQSARGRASAQARGDKPDKPARKNKRTRAERKRAQAAVPEAPAANAPKAEQAVPAAPDPKPQAESAANKDAASRPAQVESELDAADVHKEGDTEVKVMEFSGLDIEGQLKTPQMLYFLNRLRAEFGRPRLPHRSFMPELQAGTQDKAMR